MAKIPWNKIQESISDLAKLGSRELKRSVSHAKVKINTMMIVQRRKELQAELGTLLYEARSSEEELQKTLQNFIKQSEAKDIIKEIESLDDQLNELKPSA